MTQVPHSTAHERHGVAWEWLLWVLAAAVLRFTFLGRWSLWGDEAYSLIDARSLAEGEWRESLRAYPLFFMLELLSLRCFQAVASLEWTLRLVPAVSGSLAVGACFHFSRGLLSLRERRFLAALALFSPWLVFHSQYARFYSLLFLLSAVAGLSFLRALQTGRARDMTVAAASVLLAVLVHPTALLLLLGMLAVFVGRRPLALKLGPRAMGPVLILGALFALATAIGHRIVANTIAYKILHRDSGADSVVDLVQGLAYNLGLSVALLGLVGLLPLLRRDRGVGGAVVLLTGVPSLLLVALSVYGTSIEQRYLIPIVPLILVSAAVLLGRLADGLRDSLPFATAVIATLALAPYAPNLLSHYMDGNRHDIRAAADFLRERLTSDTTVVAESHYLLSFYLPEFPVERILEAPPTYRDGLRTFRETIAEAPIVWIIVPEHFLDLGGDRRAFFEWAMQEGRLERELYVPRLDYHQNRLKVFRVDTRTAHRFIPVEPPPEAG